MADRSQTPPGWPPARRLALLLLLALAGFSAIAAIRIDATLDIRAGRNEYNLAAWEARNLPSKWLYELGRIFHSGRDLATQNSDINRFLDLTREIDSLEQQSLLSALEAAELRKLRRERDRLENHVEAAIESRVSTLLKAEGLTRSPLGLVEVIWPPVDFEFTDSPQSLAISPRDRIALQESKLLREDLSSEEIERIELDVQRLDNLSARAFPIGGIGAYPTIIDYTSSYRRVIEITTHEWMHNYLFFRPLGFNYYDNNDLRTMNETVADLVAHEIAASVVARWPLAVAAPAAPSTPDSTPPPAAQDQDIDVGAELRQLRGEVEVLLEAGLIVAAEELMEDRRQELAARGVNIRKINQAYFAFTNLYAGQVGNPAAVNPIGPKVDELRRLSDSLRHFVAIAGNLTSVEELDSALASLSPLD